MLYRRMSIYGAYNRPSYTKNGIVSRVKLKNTYYSRWNKTFCSISFRIFNQLQKLSATNSQTPAHPEEQVCTILIVAESDSK